MEESKSSTTIIDISRYCSSFPDGEMWPSSQSPTARFVPQTPTCSTDSDSPILPSLPLPPSHWSLTSTLANLELDSSFSSLWSSTSISSDKHQTCSCCRCLKPNELWPDKVHSNAGRSRSSKENDSPLNIPTPIQRPSARTTKANVKLSIFDSFRDDQKGKRNNFDNEEESEDKTHEDLDDGTLRLHVSNIPFTWSKEKLAEVFGKYGTTFDVEVVYNERGSKGFGFVTFLAKKDALEAKRKMDREIVDGRRLVVNFAKPKQKSSSTSKDHQGPSFPSFKSSSSSNWKFHGSNERHSRHHTSPYSSLGFSTPPTARRQNLAGFSSLSSTPTRSTGSNQTHRHYL